MSEFFARMEKYDPRDPDPWLALLADQMLPYDSEAKAALIRCQASASRRFLLPLVRPFSVAMIAFARLLHTVSPRWPHAPRLLHRAIAFGMRHFLTPDANMLILRHFNLGAEILRFISDNATPGFHPELAPMRARTIGDVETELFLDHDLNLYNFLIKLNQELLRRGISLSRVEKLDFSAISDAVTLDPLPSRLLNRIDLQTAIEFYTPIYALLLSQRDFTRATNSLQLDETIALYVARITGNENHFCLVNNRHPLLPLSTLGAGFRLMLHGISTELLHGFLRQMKAQVLTSAG